MGSRTFSPKEGTINESVKSVAEVLLGRRVATIFFCWEDFNLAIKTATERSMGHEGETQS